jgi:hypothetical protein
MKRFSIFSLMAVLVVGVVASTLMLRGARATTLPPLIVLTGQLVPSNEVTAVTNKDLSGVGEAVVTLHVTQDAYGTITAASADFAIYALNLQGSGSIISSQISQGAAGIAGPVVVDSGVSQGSSVPLLAGGATFFKQGLAVSPTTAQDLIADASGFYFNVQTDSNPDGAIRAQLSPVSLTATPFIFIAQLSASNEVPPRTGPDATGFGLAIAAVVPTLDSNDRITGGVAKFDVIAAALPPTDEIVSSHIYSGNAAKNGSIVVDAGILPASPIALGSQGTVAFSRSGLPIPGAVMKSMLGIASTGGSASPTPSPSASPYPYSYESPSASPVPSLRFYFNIDTNLNPGGAVRGQLAQVPLITSAKVVGKNLLVDGFGFEKGSVILVNGQAVTTKNNSNSLTTSLTGKKVAELISVGATVVLVVQNSDTLPSPGFSFTRTQ